MGYRQFRRLRERVHAVHRGRRASAVGACQPIQEGKTRGERELLQRDRVHEALENACKAGRAQPAKAPGERSEHRIAGSEGVEGVNVELERQHLLESGGARLRSRVPPFPGAVQREVKRGRLRSTFLGHGDFDRRAIEHEYTAVSRSVPGINLIERSAPQRPYDQVEPERRARTKNQRRGIPPSALFRTGDRQVGWCARP